jgi:hypothetical protein
MCSVFPLSVTLKWRDQSVNNMSWAHWYLCSWKRALVGRTASYVIHATTTVNHTDSDFLLVGGPSDGGLPPYKWGTCKHSRPDCVDGTV